MDHLGRDETIRREVLKALATDAGVDESGINVDVVGGTVYLTGIVPDVFHKRLARHIAGSTKGVLSVDDELQTMRGSAISDPELKASAEAALKRGLGQLARRIQVRSVEGVIYLSGTVEDVIDRTAAEEAVRTVEGAAEVANAIAVMPIPARLDGDVEADVRHDVESSLRIKPRQVQIEVNDGVVFLRGTVNTVAQRWLAEDLARWVPGVVDVINDLKIAP